MSHQALIAAILPRCFTNPNARHTFPKAHTLLDQLTMTLHVVARHMPKPVLAVWHRTVQYHYSVRVNLLHALEYHHGQLGSGGRAGSVTVRIRKAVQT